MTRLGRIILLIISSLLTLGNSAPTTNIQTPFSQSNPNLIFKEFIRSRNVRSILSTSTEGLLNDNFTSSTSVGSKEFPVKDNIQVENETKRLQSSSSSVTTVIIEELCNEEKNDLGFKERLLCAALKDRITAKEIQNKEDYDEDEGFLPKNYNIRSAPVLSLSIDLPNGTRSVVSKPVKCLTYLSVRSVRDVDEVKEEVTLDVDVILIWFDGHIVKTLLERNVTMGSLKDLDVHMRPLSKNAAQKIWMPDLLFEEVSLLRGRPTVTDNAGRIVLIDPTTGAIFLGLRNLITLKCDMEFKYFPADTQKCPIHLRSASHYSSEVDLRWWRGNATGAYLHETSDPNFEYQITPDVKEYETAPNLGPETRPARPHRYLYFEIRFRRKMSYHLVQTYLPSLFFLVVTWLCFLIPTKMFEARVGVAMTTLLTQTSMFSSIRESTPQVGYVKAIDIWMITCIFFIFLALFVFTVGAWVRHERERIRKLKAEMEERKNRLRKSEDLQKPMRLYKVIERDIEKYTVISLSLSFLLFMIIYWSWLLGPSQYLSWNVNSTFNNIE